MYGKQFINLWLAIVNVNTYSVEQKRNTELYKLRINYYNVSNIFIFTNEAFR